MKALVIVAVVGGLAAACRQPVPAGPPPSSTLKDAFQGAFRIGAALNPSQFGDVDPATTALVVRQFNSISPENALKWDHVEPRPGGFDFASSDRYVAFGEQHAMLVIGHALVWHSQTPRWVFEDGAGRPASRDTLLARMHTHIHAVVGRYKGRIRGWDVVNEALDDDGSLRQSPWLRIIGPDYIAKAFEFAHEADPAAELYYNDYDLDFAAKRDAGVRLVKSLLAQGIHVAAVGLQGHYKLNEPSVAEVDSTIRAFARLGVKVNITELDVDLLPRPARLRNPDVSMRAEPEAALDPYPTGLPESMQQALAKRYAVLFALYFSHRDVITRVTFWGVTDRDSWLNGWPVRGRTSYPLLFDRQGKSKPALDAVLGVAARATRSP